MTSSDPATLTIVEAARLLGTRRLSPVELVRSTLERIARFDPGLHAYTTVSAEYALDCAREAEEQITHGNYRGSLHGIPYSLKDLIDTAGIRTTYGYRSWADYVPNASATVHEKLEAAGAILLGKVECHLNRGVPVTCRNPWDLSRSPGWSSSGSGAAVAASMCLASIGSDTAGSIRIPAAWSGVVGLKPTRGLVSRYNAFVPCWSTDTLGPLTKTVEDAAIVLRAIAGFDSKDPVSLALPVADCSQGGTPEIHGLKVGVLRELTVRESTEDVEAAVSAAVEVLRDLGASTKDVSVQSEPLARAAMTVIQRVECGVYYSRHMGRQRLAALDSDVKEWLRLTHSYTIDEYLNAQETAAVIRQELLVLLNDVDIIVGPTCPTAALEPTLLTPILTLAPHQHGTGSITVRGSRVNAKALATRGTVLGSLANLPCLSVPCGFSSESLPIGLQLMGPPLNEGVLLRVGMAYQAATDWHLRQPVLLDP